MDNIQEKTHNNICVFADEPYLGDELSAFQFIYETMPQNLKNPRAYPAFCCCLMTQGTARLETQTGAFPVSSGDLFFTFSAEPFSLVNCYQAQYLYISFVGQQAEEYLASVGVCREKPVFSGFEGLRDAWFYGILNTTSQNLSMLTKGLLTYTLSILPRVEQNSKSLSGKELVRQLQCDVDCCYANVDLSLEHLCRLHHYNSKYVSRRFREVTGINFSEYLQNCRIHHACNLLKETDRPIHEIATGVGYRDAMYFSKVFRKCVGRSPSDYRALSKL